MDFDRDYRHPYHVERAPVWTAAQHHYDGGRLLRAKNASVSPPYLRQFWIEKEEDYKRRLDRAMALYDNLVRRSLAVYLSQLYRLKPQRPNLPGEVEPALLDLDMLGTGADSFFATVVERADLFEWCGVLVDAPRAPADGRQRSEAEVRQERVRPWCERVEPLQVVDWVVEQESTARRGRLNKLVIRDEYTRRGGVMASGTKVERFRIYTLDSVQIVEVVEGHEPIALEPVPHVGVVTGEIPFVVHYSNFVAPMKGATIFDDVVLGANALWNTWSALDEAFYYQCFNLLVVKSDEEVSELKLSEKRGLKVGAADAIEYLAPGATPFEVGRDRIKDIIERVADLVFNRTERQLPTAQVESAEKRSMDRDEFLALLESKAERAEKTEAEVWRLLSLAWGAGEKEIEVEYNRNFRVDDRPADEWSKLTEAGIFSLAEWYMREHPTTTSEEKAWEAVKENLKRNREASPRGQSEELARAGLIDAMRQRAAMPPQRPKAATEPEPPPQGAPPGTNLQ